VPDVPKPCPTPEPIAARDRRAKAYRRNAEQAQITGGAAPAERLHWLADEIEKWPDRDDGDVAVTDQL
jgi:hypothetical protein